MKDAISRETWDLSVSSMIFGGQEFNHNAHKCGFDRKMLCSVLEDAGFTEVYIETHDMTPTDMIATAVK